MPIWSARYGAFGTFGARKWPFLGFCRGGRSSRPYLAGQGLVRGPTHLKSPHLHPSTRSNHSPENNFSMIFLWANKRGPGDGGGHVGVGGVRTRKKIFPERAKYSLVPMIVWWKLWLRGCSQKQKSRGLLISSTRYGAFDPFWGPNMGRFWPSALVERGEGGRISATKRGNWVISSTGNFESTVLITASILVETNIWLLLGVLFPVLLGGRGVW